MRTSELEKCLLRKNFIRIHKSYIVTLDKIDTPEKDLVIIKNEKLPIGIKYRRKLADRLKNITILCKLIFLKVSKLLSSSKLLFCIIQTQF
ncbi:MAG: LytTR family transcriptional regulator DNA-binding domain-containing protein [Bacteroidota bacterium]